jgi:hypothetical protein
MPFVPVFGRVFALVLVFGRILSCFDAAREVDPPPASACVYEALCY